MYTNIDGAAKGISDYVSKVERMKTTVAFRNEYMFSESKSYFTLELKPKLDQYYILEVLSDPFGKYDKTVSVNDGVVSVNETYRTSSSSASSSPSAGAISRSASALSSPKEAPERTGTRSTTGEVQPGLMELQQQGTA